MATPNIVPRVDQEGGLGTAAKGWGKLFIENATDGGTAAVTVSNLDIDQVALDINANNTSANIIDVVAGALSGGAGLYLNTADGQNDIKIVSSADTADYCTLATTANGATTLTTVDGGAAAANFEVAADGNITLDPASDLFLDMEDGSNIDFKNDGNVAGRFFAESGAQTIFTLYEDGGDSTTDFLSIKVATHGATTLTTVDDAAAAAHFEIAADGNITLDAAGDIVLETGTTSVNSTDIPLRKYSLPSSTVGDYSGGDVYYYGSGSTVKGSIYYMASGGGWTLTDADTEAASKGLLAVALGTNPDVDGMLLRGFVTLLTEVEGTEAIGSTLYLSATAGVATITVPGSGDQVRVIGYSLHATDNQVYFNPAGTFVELA